MEHQRILENIGQFPAADIALFKLYTSVKTFGKAEPLLKQGEVCNSVYYVLSGSFVQAQAKEGTEIVVDLHTANEWVFNSQSLIEQKASGTTIYSFEESKVLVLSLMALHSLISKSQSFLQFGTILNQAGSRTHIFDNSLNPAEKYAYILKARPAIVKTFPIKLIASYLKIAPETLSRVRAR